MRGKASFFKSYSVIIVKQNTSGATVSENELDLSKPLKSNGKNLPFFMGTTPRYAFFGSLNSYHVVELDTLKITHVPCSPKLFGDITAKREVVDENTLRMSDANEAFEYSINGAREIHAEPEKVIYH